MSAPRPLGRRLLDGWLVVAMRFGEVQTAVLLALFYAFLIGPMAGFAGAARWDMLSKRNLRAPGSVWHDADSAKPDLERAKLQS
jgi:hypothetical protein